MVSPALYPHTIPLSHTSMLRESVCVCVYVCMCVCVCVCVCVCECVSVYVFLSATVKALKPLWEVIPNVPQHCGCHFFRETFSVKYPSFYWVGPKVLSSFSIRCHGKTRRNSLASLIFSWPYWSTPSKHLFCLHMSS